MPNPVSRAPAMIILAAFASVFACEHKEERPAPKPAPKKAPAVAAGTIVGATTAEKMRKEAVKLKPAGGTRWQPAVPGTTINAGDSILVEADGAVMLSLKSGARLSLNAGTILKLLSPTAAEITFGEIWLEHGAAGEKGALKVKTKFAEISLAGAAAGISVDETTVSTSVVTGNAQLEGPFGELAIRAGQEGVADAEGARIVHIKDPGGLVSWTKGLRAAIAPTSDDSPLERFRPSSGLGSLAARMPGGGAPLPFQILSEEVTVRIQDHVALTRIEQIFKNPTNQVVEGTYKFPLPSGARLTRYDMEIGGTLKQGEIVERKRGRQIMNTVIRQFQDRMRDPALTEWESGSTFKTRIFPIQAQEKKRIVLSYLETLTGGGGRYRYVLPIRPAGGKSPRIPVFRLNASVGATGGPPRVTSPLYPMKISGVGQHTEVNFTENDFEPQVDLALEIHQPEQPEAALSTFAENRNPVPVSAFPTQGSPAVDQKTGGDTYFMLRLSPTLPETASTQYDGNDWILLADTSRSRTRIDMEIEKRLVDTLIGIMGPYDRVKVLAFDMRPSVLDAEWGVPSQAMRERARSFLDGISPGGATDMAEAIREASRQLDPNRSAKVIILGDGAATLGENRPGPLSNLAADLLGSASVTTLGVGSSVDAPLLKTLSRKTGGNYHGISSGEDLLAAAVRVVAGLRTATLENPTVVFEGLDIRDVFPKTPDHLTGGQELILTGRYRGTGRLTATLKGTVGERPWEKSFAFDVRETTDRNAFIPILWASARIDELSLRDDPAAVRQIVALSKKYSIPSRHTSFLVLENQAMHREFNVARTDDRFEWTGEDSVEYEAADDELLGETFGGDVKAIATGGGPGAESGAPLGVASGMARRAPAPKKAKAASRSAEKRPVASRPPIADPEAFADGPMPPSMMRPPCRKTWEYNTRVWQIPARARPRDLEEIATLATKIESDRLSRKLRQDLVKQLFRFGRYRDAETQVTQWLQMDRDNPQVITYAGDLLRLRGRTDEALRMYSGILDVKPEARGVMEMIASYLESKSRWKEAHPFRVSLSITKPSDEIAKARMAIAAHRAGRFNEALAVIGELTVQGPTGALRIRPGVRLTNDLKAAVLGIAAEGRTPTAEEAPTAEAARSARFKMAIHWNNEQNLDLWVSKPGEKFMGGTHSRARLVSGESGADGEILYMPSAVPGKYRVQVICAEPGGCATPSGTLEIRAHGTRRTVPFTLTDGWGTDLAVVVVERRRKPCAYDYY